MSRKNEFAQVFAMASIVLWILDSLFVFLFPRFSLTLTEWWFHGLDIAPLGDFSITWQGFVFGGISFVVAAAITGYVFGWALDTVRKRQ